MSGGRSSAADGQRGQRSAPPAEQAAFPGCRQADADRRPGVAPLLPVRLPEPAPGGKEKGGPGGSRPKNRSGDQRTGRIQPPESSRSARRLTGRPTTVDQEPCTPATRKAPWPWMA